MTTSRASHAITRSRVLTEAAAAGMERSLWCLTQSSPAVCGGSPGASYAGESNLTIGAATVTTTVDSVDANTRTLSATARLTGASLTFRATAKNRLDPVAFVYATQIGDGGLTMNNNSTVNGDLFSNGSIAGATGATLNGDVSVASTTILKATVNGAARADTIKDSTINGDAYYQTLINTPVSGTKFPGTPAPAPLELPITSATIAAWKEDAASGGITLGDYRPDAGSSVSLGPREITGNLILDNNQILTLTGTVYVRGNIEISNNATIRLDSAYGSNSGIFVADGTIHLENNGNFQGAGAGSFLMFFSAAAGSGHHDSAIDLHNNASGTVFYASRGLIHLHNNVEVSELAGFKVHLSNNAVVNYNEALKDAVFASGPGGRWALVKGTFREIK